MSVSPEQFKERTRKLILAAQDLREGVLMLPVLRKPIIEFTRQLRQRQSLSPEQIQVLQQQLPAEQNVSPNVETPHPVFPRFQRPRLLQTTQMPIRQAIGNVINSLTARTATQKQQVEKDESEQPNYAEEYKRRKFDTKKLQYSSVIAGG